MYAIERRLVLLTRVAAVLGAFFLLVVAAMSVVDIVTRAITGFPIDGVADIGKLLTIIIIASSFPAGLMERKQVEVRLLSAVVGPRVGLALDILGTLLTTLMFAAMAYYVTQYAMRTARINEYTMVLQLPVAPLWWAAAACFWTCLPVQLFITISDLVGHRLGTQED